MEVMEYKKTYREYEAEIDGEFQQAAERFVKIGYLLKVARDTDILKESGYRDVHEFAKRRYGLDKSQVSRLPGSMTGFPWAAIQTSSRTTIRDSGIQSLRLCCSSRMP